jgi:hypothetical protein
VPLDEGLVPSLEPDPNVNEDSDALGTGDMLAGIVVNCALESRGPAPMPELITLSTPDEYSIAEDGEPKVGTIEKDPVVMGNPLVEGSPA